ncbi:MAG: DUF4115 domain-containing protein [Candidatus Omnitrophica bacterium]|nr:DUF4115 domain-containing protein [Candidatus Omnitrophota bacterium]
MMTESTGARLKKIRLEKGLSLEEAHKKTKMHMRVLKALEEDNLVNVNPVYVRGFLKIYCKFLGVDPAVFPDYKEPVRSMRTHHAQTENISIKIKSPARLLKADFLKPYLNKRILVWALSAAVFILMLFVLGKFIASRRSRNIIPQARYAGVSQKRPVGFEPIKPRANYAFSAGASGQAKITKEPKSEAAMSPGVRLVMRARQDCYIQLKTDGHTAFHGTLKKGKSETWTAKEKIEFSLSNASAVSLELNGEPVPLLAKKKRILKNVQVTRDGHINIL